MDPIRYIRQDQRTELKREVKQPLGQLTLQDLARLNAKHEEIIMVLRFWHGYGRMAADRSLSNWLNHNSLPPVYRDEDASPA
jgi:hypothetical protein